jgi:hypothetical protein
LSSSNEHADAELDLEIVDAIVVEQRDTDLDRGDGPRRLIAPSPWPIAHAFGAGADGTPPKARFRGRARSTVRSDRDDAGSQLGGREPVA